MMGGPGFCLPLIWPHVWIYWTGRLWGRRGRYRTCDRCGKEEFVGEAT